MKIEVSETLGQRIVAAARVAVAMHLQQQVEQISRDTRQRVAIGGAGPHYVTDDELPAATGRAERLTASARPSHPLSDAGSNP